MSVKSVIVLLNNVDELVTVSNARKEAVDAMKALKIYAKNQHINVPEQKIDQYISVVWDSRPLTLSAIVRDIAMDVVRFNKPETTIV